VARRTFTGQFSLAGAQAKTALVRSGERWGVPSGSTPTTHVLKPAVAGLDDGDVSEHLCLDAARRAGLTAARTAVSRFDDETAVVVTRYDPLERDGSIVRVHQEDLCQALSVPPDGKYENEGGPGVERVATLLRDAMPARESGTAVRRFADALIWNWLIAGTDAFADAAREPQVTALARPLPSTLADLVADRAERCRELLKRTAPS
jgi:serine/threonine-protein kinase HipA